MKFFKRTLYKNRINMQYNNISLVAMEYGNLLSKYIEWDINSGTLIYRNRISPTLAGRPFPEGYFDEKSLILEKKYTQYARKLISKCLKELTFENDLDTLPAGASREAYLRLEDSTGKMFYYTNAHFSKSGSFVESEKTADTFVQLFAFLEKQCSFPELTHEMQRDLNLL